MTLKPIIGITMGDPKGIGPEVIQKALSRPSVRRQARFIVFGGEKYFSWKNAWRLSDKDCGRLSGFYIEQAAHAAIKGEINALVTGPISKEKLRKAGYPYPGHTEFLADLSGARRVRMMMAGPTLKVVLVTIHEPLRKVPALLTQKNILETIRITDHHLKKWFRVKRPRIAVAGLNPHAGESGLFGLEERRFIAPAIRWAQREGIVASGPYPPDTLFYRAVQDEFDVVVALYHDQGLIPLKLLHFDQAVNITLGLPFIRTSVDHGTAFDIAGKEKADSRSMIAAIEMAVELVKRRKT